MHRPPVILCDSSHFNENKVQNVAGLSLKAASEYLVFQFCLADISIFFLKLWSKNFFMKRTSPFLPMALDGQDCAILHPPKQWSRAF